MSPMPCNRHKPNPPLSMIEAELRALWDEGLSDVQILQCLVKLIPPRYGLGIKKLRKMREELGLFSVRKQGHSIESITPAMTLLRPIYSHAGRREMLQLLYREHGLKVSREVYDRWTELYEPDLVRQRRSRRLKRKRFHAAGCHDLWCCDQHDKWKRFGLGIHVCLDPFTGQVIWLKIWWGNRNPRLIFGYYLEAVRRLGYTCLVGQGDTGSENWCFAKGHTYIRHALDPALEGTIQFRFMRSKKNIAPEIFWSGFRSRFAPGFEDILDAPLRFPRDLRYDPADPLQYNVFKWIFIPWLQFELDRYADRINKTKKRYQRNKILPQRGCPNNIEAFPEEYGVRNFKIIVDPNAPCLREAEQLYAPPEHPTFELVPATFAMQAKAWYESQGCPEVNRTNVWNRYMDMLTYFEARPDLLADIPLQPQPEEEKEGAGNDYIPPEDDLLANLEAELQIPRSIADSYGGGSSDLGRGDVSGFELYDEVDCERLEVELTDEEDAFDSVADEESVTS